MTVAELRGFLLALPPEADGWQVVLSADAEGNRYSPLAGVETGNAEAPVLVTGQVGLVLPWRMDFLPAGEIEDDPDLAALPINAVCLSPVR